MSSSYENKTKNAVFFLPAALAMCAWIVYLSLDPKARAAEHEGAELFLQASLQSKVISVMKEKGSANSAAKERPFDLVWHPLVPPHSVELSPSDL